jgi:hypothetical protein
MVSVLCEYLLLSYRGDTNNYLSRPTAANHWKFGKELINNHTSTLCTKALFVSQLLQTWRRCETLYPIILSCTGSVFK